ncbi:tetratricopeptide repeat protein, partial [Acinetobacter sp. 11520]|nr:tetratricopeptide repeat protein [Acinetobacter sp. 11520]
CRFYVDDTVPVLVQQRLKEKGAQVIQVADSQKQLSGLFWRFLVMDDPTIKRFLIRDADSIVSHREKAAVDVWLKSDKWFHLMRDNYSHTELI